MPPFAIFCHLMNREEKKWRSTLECGADCVEKVLNSKTLISTINEYDYYDLNGSMGIDVGYGSSI